MKKRLIAFGGAAAVLVGAAAIPLNSAHGALSLDCRVLQAQDIALNEQLVVLENQPQTPSVRTQEKALNIRIQQILAAGRGRCFG